MHKPQYLIGAIAIALGLVIMLFSTQAKALSGLPHNSIVAADSDCSPHPNVLGEATEQEIADVALTFTRKNYPSEDEEPTVRFVRRVQADDLPNLGLQSMPKYVKNPPPYAVVIVKGNFNMKDMRPSHGYDRPGVQYIGYIYDLWSGFPTVEILDPTGSSFRIALNDSSIPTPLPTSVIDQPVADVLPTVSGWKKLPCYGDTLSGSSPASLLEPTNTPLPFEPASKEPSYPPPVPANSTYPPPAR